MKKHVKKMCLVTASVVIMLAAGCGKDDGDIAVTAITLNNATLTLDPGATQKLTATVVPENATDKRVVWSSEAEAVATVNDGLVTAVAPGSTRIWVKTPDGKVSASATVTVNDLDVTDEITGSYKGTASMDGNPIATDLVITLTRKAINVVTLSISTNVEGASIQITCALNVSTDGNGEYSLAGTGTTNDFGAGVKNVTASGNIYAEGNIALALSIDAISDNVQFAGKKQ